MGVDNSIETKSESCFEAVSFSSTSFYSFVHCLVGDCFTISTY